MASATNPHVALFAGKTSPTNPHMGFAVEDPRRAYLARHGVEKAVTAAVTKVLQKRPASPIQEIGLCLLDAGHAPPSALAMISPQEYVAAHGIKAAVSAAIKMCANAMPADPIASIGSALAYRSEFEQYWAPSAFA